VALSFPQLTVVGTGNGRGWRSGEGVSWDGESMVVFDGTLSINGNNHHFNAVWAARVGVRHFEHRQEHGCYEAALRRAVKMDYIVVSVDNQRGKLAALK